MKRSEMLSLLTSELKGNYPLAEHILNVVEKAGMLPPENPNLSQEVIDNCLSGNYWEIEDEEK